MQASAKPDLVQDVRYRAVQKLRTVSESPELDAELMLREVLGLNRVEMLFAGQEFLLPDEREWFDTLLKRRLGGEPMAYILGRRSFRSIELIVDARVLDPRPETEELVQIGLDWIARKSGPLRIADVGTGSGAIALSLAAELKEQRSEFEVVAGDISPKALTVAEINQIRLGLAGRVTFVESDLLAKMPGRFDLILANLPYLRPDQQHDSTRFEPDIALYGGDDGFDHYRRLLPMVGEKLMPGGLLVFEIDPSQANFGRERAQKTTSLPASVRHDLSGRVRFILVGDVNGPEE